MAAFSPSCHQKQKKQNAPLSSVTFFFRPSSHQSALSKMRRASFAGCLSTCSDWLCGVSSSPCSHLQHMHARTGEHSVHVNLRCDRGRCEIFHTFVNAAVVLVGGGRERKKISPTQSQMLFTDWLLFTPLKSRCRHITAAAGEQRWPPHY